jgi:hypothetical protein
VWHTFPDRAAPDLRTVEALCELQLAARRLGCTIRVHDPSPELRDLIVLAGLAAVLLTEVGGAVGEEDS